MATPENPKWLLLVNKYIDHLKFERRYSANTVHHYYHHLNDAALFLEQHVSAWSKVESDHLRHYLSHLKRAQLSARSINLKLSCLRSFFKYLQHQKAKKKQYIANPGEVIKGPKFTKPLPKNLDVDQVNQLLEMPIEDALSARDKAMMELMYSSGLRISELVNINLGDIRDNQITVMGKGSKERILPVGKKAIDAINQWLSVRLEFVGDDPEALFLSKQKRRISTRQVRARMKQWGIKQGISADVHPHKLRHSFASHILESSGDLRAVQELLGHSNLSTTQVYTHLDFQHLAKVYDNTHPRAKRK